MAYALLSFGSSSTHEYQEISYQPQTSKRVSDGRFLFFVFYKEIQVPEGNPVKVCKICLRKKSDEIHRFPTASKTKENKCLTNKNT